MTTMHSAERHPSPPATFHVTKSPTEGPEPQWPTPTKWRRGLIGGLISFLAVVWIAMWSWKQHLFSWCFNCYTNPVLMRQVILEVYIQGYLKIKVDDLTKENMFYSQNNKMDKSDPVPSIRPFLLTISRSERCVSSSGAQGKTRNQLCIFWPQWLQ